MAELLEEALGLTAPGSLLSEIRTPGSSLFKAPNNIEAISFSGGVADCIDERGGDSMRYGDIGPLLGRAIAESRLCKNFQRLPADETIRATVAGAGSYTTTVSGSTIFHRGDGKILPLKNVPVLKLNRAEQDRCFDGDADYLTEKIRWLLEQNDEDRLMLAMTGEPSPSYEKLKRLAGCLSSAMDRALPREAPILLALECDTAKALGQTIGNIAGNRRSLICIDAVHADQGDYVDLGRPLMGDMVIPVVIKTLAFR
jgi:ethanolamine utilization protein EutA